MASDRRLTSEQMAQLEALEGRQPDTVDSPEAPAALWPDAQRGAFFKARKAAISLRVDMDVLDWLRRKGASTWKLTADADPRPVQTEAGQ